KKSTAPGLVCRIGFGPSDTSLSLMVTVAVEGEPRLPPVGLVKTTLKVSGPSPYESLIIGTSNVFADASPAAHVSVPTTVAKSHRPKACPALLAQFTVKLSVSAVL